MAAAALTPAIAAAASVITARTNVRQAAVTAQQPTIVAARPPLRRHQAHRAMNVVPHIIQRRVIIAAAVQRVTGLRVLATAHRNINVHRKAAVRVINVTGVVIRHRRIVPAVPRIVTEVLVINVPVAVIAAEARRYVPHICVRAAAAIHNAAAAVWVHTVVTVVHAAAVLAPAIHIVQAVKNVEVILVLPARAVVQVAVSVVLPLRIVMAVSHKRKHAVMVLLQVAQPIQHAKHQVR